MLIRFLLALMIAAPVAAQVAAPAGPPPVRVVMTTTEGPITIEVDRAAAPVTAANFLRYVDAKRLDGITFFRAMRVAWGPGLIQAGQHDVKKLYRRSRTSRRRRPG